MARERERLADRVVLPAALRGGGLIEDGEAKVAHGA